jgi:hypothetical protein
VAAGIEIGFAADGDAELMILFDRRLYDYCCAAHGGAPQRFVVPARPAQPARSNSRAMSALFDTPGYKDIMRTLGEMSSSLVALVDSLQRQEEAVRSLQADVGDVGSDVKKFGAANEVCNAM